MLAKIEDAWPMIDDPILVDVSIRGFGRAVITPAVAERWLERNTENRRVRRALVEYLKKQMKGCEWQDDHPQPIIFDDRGILQDGQHRLIACRDSGVPITSRVEFGSPRRMREYIDTGISRTLEDRVELVPDLQENYTICKVIVSMYMIRKGNTARPTPEEAHDLFLIHREALNWIARVSKRKQGKIDQVAVLLAFTEMYEHNANKASQFHEALRVVDGSIQQARVLRDYLLRSMTSSARGEVRERFGKCIAAMRAYLDNKEIRILRATDWT